MSKIEQEISGVVTAVIDGREYRLKLTMEALALFDENPARSGARGFRSLLWALMRMYHPALSVVDVGRLVSGESMQAAAVAVAEALRVGFGDAAAGADQEPDARGGIDWWLLWSFGRHDLRLPDAEFWAATPQQFSALSARHTAEYEHSAVICATLAEIYRDPEKRPEPWRVEDFMPRVRAAAADDKQAKLDNVKRLMAKAEQLNALIGGRFVKG